MIKKIHFNQYRKLKNLDIEFTKNINIISGTNGTCKTSILHLCSNAFQAPKKNNVVSIINAINMITNPKIETLTKGDKKYNDPAPNTKGSLLDVMYFDDIKQEFRRHKPSKTNILKKNNRFRLILKYPKGQRSKLKIIPTIYLGLPRLFPFGELDDKEKKDKQYDKMKNIINTLPSEQQNELNKILKIIEKKQNTSIKNIEHKLPDEYQEEIYKLYKELTNISITQTINIKIENIKSRTDFNTDIEGIDSNTISAGEDNIMIILTALVSLKYYYDNISHENDEVISILLIDELDATLHPEMQANLLNIITEYSKNYKIQVICTSHSLSLIEYGFKYKANIIYIQDTTPYLTLMEDPTLEDIKAFLNNKIIKYDKPKNHILIYTEDKEARFFFNKIVEHEKTDKYFKNLKSVLHILDINYGSKELLNLFNDKFFLENSKGVFCILDGDQQPKLDIQINKFLSQHIIFLPGNDSPEKVLYNYALNNENIPEFWAKKNIARHGNMQAEFSKIKNQFTKLKKENKKDREIYKELFNNNNDFFDIMCNIWLDDDNNNEKLKFFYVGLKNMLYKTLTYYQFKIDDYIKEDSFK